MRINRLSWCNLVRHRTTAIVAFAVLCAASSEGIAETTYYYTGTPYTLAGGAYTTSMRLTGSVTFNSPLAPNTVNNFDFSASNPATFKFFDGLNTISNSDPNISYKGSILFATNTADQIIYGNFGAGWSTTNPNSGATFYTQINSIGKGVDIIGSNNTPYSGQARSFVAGSWSGPSAGPAISFTVKATLGDYISNTPGAATSIKVSATASNNVSLQIAAQNMGYKAIDWVQFDNIISPSPFTSKGNTVTGPTFDPPPGGWDYPGSTPSFPFYYDPLTLATAEGKFNGNLHTPVISNSGSMISLIDQPVDFCLPGGDPVKCKQAPAKSGFNSYSDELVGVVACSTPGVGSCDSQGLTYSAPIPFSYNGKTVTQFQYNDNFNGTAGGIARQNNFDVRVDPLSGSGGITIAMSVPEPTTLSLFLTCLPVVGIAVYRRRQTTHCRS